jgi:hypothetical protein
VKYKRKKSRRKKNSKKLEDDEGIYPKDWKLMAMSL